MPPSVMFEQIMEPNLSIRHFVNFMKMLASRIKHLLLALLSRNDIVERQNRMLVEAARTILIFSKAPLFLWAEAINTTCYTQNRSLIHLRYNKNPYELILDKKSDLSFFHVFGALCYPTNDNDNLGKLDAKADIGIFDGYAPAKKAFRIYNKRTQAIPLSAEEESHDLEVAHMSNDPYFGIPNPETVYKKSSSSDVISTIVHPDAPISEHPIK
ncbi:retrovirus-related pol polyprotein from transposon TNT 1-94 [Tanacetum coccineum]